MSTATPRAADGPDDPLDRRGWDEWRDAWTVVIGGEGDADAVAAGRECRAMIFSRAPGAGAALVDSSVSRWA